MSKFKHDLLLRLIKLVDAVLMTIPFALCWYLYYSDRTASPFDQKGNLIVVLLFLVLFIIFGRIYDAFMMSIQQISEIVYAQFLAVAVSDLIIYPTDIRDVRKVLSIDELMDELRKFDDEKLYPYVVGLIEKLKIAVSPSPMII